MAKKQKRVRKPRKSKRQATFASTCGFYGKSLVTKNGRRERGAGQVYPVPGSDDITEGRQACAACRKEKTDELIALGVLIPVDLDDDKLLADPPMPKRKRKAIPFRAKVLKLIQERPLTDKQLLEHLKLRKKDIRKVRRNLYKLRRAGGVQKQQDGTWVAT